MALLLHPPCSQSGSHFTRTVTRSGVCACAGSNTANASFEGSFYKKAGLEIGPDSVNGVLYLGSNASWVKYPSEGRCIRESPRACSVVLLETRGSLTRV